MLRKVIAWSALVAFTLLNAGGEALHHAEFLGFHSRDGGTSTSCGCTLHQDAPADLKQDGGRVESRNLVCNHDCVLCQYYAQTNPVASDSSDVGVEQPRCPNAVVLPSCVFDSGLAHAWFARGPPAV